MTKNFVETPNLPSLDKGLPDIGHNIGHKALHLAIDRESDWPYGLKH